MAIVDLLVSTATGGELPSSAGRIPKLIDETIDTASQNLGAADVAVLAFIPPRHYIEAVRLEVETVEGGVATVDIGLFSDAGTTAIDADGFIDGADVNAATMVNSAEGATAYAKGYTTGATGAYLCLTAVAALDAAKLRVQALVKSFQ